MPKIEIARKVHLALWLILGLWLAVGWGLVWPTGWVWVVGLVVLAALWVAVFFREQTGGSYSPWSSLLPKLLGFYWGKLHFEPATRRWLEIHLTLFGIAAGLLAIGGYQRWENSLSLLMAFILLAVTIVIYWLRAYLTPTPHG